MSSPTVERMLETSARRPVARRPGAVRAWSPLLLAARLLGGVEDGRAEADADPAGQPEHDRDGGPADRVLQARPGRCRRATPWAASRTPTTVLRQRRRGGPGRRRHRGGPRDRLLAGAPTSGATARAWVFARPVDAAFAGTAIASSRDDRGLPRSTDGPAYGDPSVTQTCRLPDGIHAGPARRPVRPDLADLRGARPRTGERRPAVRERADALVRRGGERPQHRRLSATAR